MNLKKGLAIGLGIAVIVGLSLVGCKVDQQAAIKAAVPEISSVVEVEKLHPEFSNITTCNEQGTPDGPSMLQAADFVSAAMILQKRGEFGVVIRRTRSYASCRVPRILDT